MLATLQDSFVRYLPWMRKTARLAFQNLEADKQDEQIAATLALAWKHWHRLGERGRADEPGILKSVLFYSVKQIRAGRRIDSAGKPRDVLSLRAYGKVRFEPGHLDDYVGKHDEVLDVVSFRLDVPAFLATLNDRQRTMALDLANGMSTTEAAEKYGLSLGRISQCRRELVSLYEQFVTE
jgi:DNA-directed RNA polymerase specialized sigma24 family protein